MCSSHSERGSFTGNTKWTIINSLIYTYESMTHLTSKFCRKCTVPAFAAGSVHAPSDPGQEMCHGHGRRNPVSFFRSAGLAQSDIHAGVRHGLVRIVIVGQELFFELAFVGELCLRRKVKTEFGYNWESVQCSPTQEHLFVFSLSIRSQNQLWSD